MLRRKLDMTVAYRLSPWQVEGLEMKASNLKSPLYAVCCRPYTKVFGRWVEETYLQLQARMVATGNLVAIRNILNP